MFQIFREEKTNSYQVTDYFFLEITGLKFIFLQKPTLNSLNLVFAFLSQICLRFVIQGVFTTFGTNQTIELCTNLL